MALDFNDLISFDWDGEISITREDTTEEIMEKTRFVCGWIDLKATLRCRLCLLQLGEDNTFVLVSLRKANIAEKVKVYVAL